MDSESQTDFDRMVAELQQEIVEREKALYSDAVRREAGAPKNMGRMEDADLHGVVHGWCGDTMEIYLRLDNGSTAGGAASPGSTAGGAASPGSTAGGAASPGSTGGSAASPGSTTSPTIKEATFVTDGCGATLACGSMLTQIVTGMKLEKAEWVLPEDLIKALGGLPEEHEHCAGLAVSTLQNALFNWRVSQTEEEKEGDDTG
jgi:nitrogen fixation NifU-like protein